MTRLDSTGPQAGLPDFRFYAHERLLFAMTDCLYSKRLCSTNEQSKEVNLLGTFPRHCQNIYDHLGCFYSFNFCRLSTS